MSKKINEEVIKNISRNTLYLRRVNDFSKKEMAEILGIGVTSYAKIEKGILPPRLSVRFLFRIQEYFGVSAADLVSMEIETKLKLLIQ